MNLSVHFDSTRSISPAATTPSANRTSFAQVISSSSENPVSSSSALAQMTKTDSPAEKDSLQKDATGLLKGNKASLLSMTHQTRREATSDKKLATEKAAPQSPPVLTTAAPTPAPKPQPVALGQGTDAKPESAPDASSTQVFRQADPSAPALATSNSEVPQPGASAQTPSAPGATSLSGVASVAKTSSKDTKPVGTNGSVSDTTGDADVAANSDGNDVADAAPVSNAPDGTDGGAGTAVPTQPGGFIVPQSLVMSPPTLQASRVTDGQPSLDATVGKPESGVGKWSTNATNGVAKQKVPAASSTEASTVPDGTQASSLTFPGKESTGNQTPQHQGSANDGMQQTATPVSHTVAAAQLNDPPAASAAPADVAAAARVQSQALDAEVASSRTVMNASQLIQTMHQSEMRVGMNSAEFGAISISTSISHQVLSASISLGHAELSSALALHMPAIQEKLSNAYGVQARVELRDAGNAGQQDNSQQAKQGQQGSNSTKNTSGSTTISQTTGSVSLPASLTTSANGPSTRLDVLY